MSKSKSNFQGMLIARYGKEALIFHSESHSFFRTKIRAHCRDAVIGEQILFEKQTAGDAVITECQPRRNALERIGFGQKVKAVAANVDCVFIVICSQPATPIGELDRYLVGAALSDIEARIIINKSDLLEGSSLSSDMALYQSLGYRCYLTNCLSGELGSLDSDLPDGNVIFVGQSGVGKSSLINTLIPSQPAAVGQLSTNQQLGKHTTTTAQAYQLANGWLMDSPGIRQFQFPLQDKSKLQSGFIEFAAFHQHCRFRNCSHEAEPGCKVKEAVENGLISPLRYQSYLAMLHE